MKKKQTNKKNTSCSSIITLKKYDLIYIIYIAIKIS